MQFELTEGTIDDILFYMENQNGDFVFDSVISEVVPCDEFDEYADYESAAISQYDNVTEDDGERFYNLPEWTSVDGFRLMEHFAGNLRNPPAKKDLMNVLSSGRGVFRNFKNILAKYPEVEKFWYIYKDDQMKKKIRQWYNDLRESWHLARLNYDDDTEETSDAILGDFTIREGSLTDSKIIADVYKKMSKEFSFVLEDSLFAMANNELWKRQIIAPEGTTALILLAETPSGESAGMIQINPVSEKLSNCGLVTLIYVETAYRGLGLGSALLEKGIEYAKKNKMQRLIASNVILPDGFAQVLVRHNFYRSGSGYLLNLDTNG